MHEGRRVEFSREAGEAVAGFGGHLEQFGLVAAGHDDHEVAQEIDHFGKDLLGAHAFLEEFVGQRDGGGGVAVGDGLDQGPDGLDGRAAEEIFEHFVGDMVFADGEDAVEDGEGVAHGAVAEAGDAEDGIGVGVDGFILEDGGEVLGDARGGDVFEIEALAAGDDGGGDLVDVGGGEDELDVLGRFFEGFEQGVEGAAGEHVHFVDDVDFEGGACGADAGGLAEFADLVDGIIRGPVDLDDVHILAAADGLAGFAGAAGVAVGGAVGAVDGFGEDACGGGFADAARAGEEKGVGDAVGADGVFEGLGDGLLAHELIEGDRAVAAGQNCVCVCHGWGIIAEDARGCTGRTRSVSEGFWGRPFFRDVPPEACPARPLPRRAWHP